MAGVKKTKDSSWYETWEASEKRKDEKEKKARMKEKYRRDLKTNLSIIQQK